jgi:hypothetical protein
VTGPVLPRPPDPFPPYNPYRLAAGSELHRNHLRSLRSAQFNPGFGLPSRFAPFDDEGGRTVPTLYAGTTREAAVYETIFHDIDPAALFKTVRQHVVEARTASRITPTRDLLLASLFTPDLAAWGLARTDLIQTPKSTYDQTVIWAAAIHAAHRDVDGLVWTSVRCDPELCVMLFGDRVDEADLQVIDRLEVAADATLLLELREYGKRAGIIIVS